jgi:hypothetical protein
MFLKRTPGRVMLAILLGGLIGDVVGEILRALIPGGAVRDLLLNKVTFGFDTFTLHLAVVQFSLGLMISFNLLAVIFMFVVIYMLLKF